MTRERWRLIAFVMSLDVIFVTGIALHSDRDSDVEKAPTIIERTVLASEMQRVDFFIDELLTKKSAACFRAILSHESHINSKAINSDSGARGVGQILASTYRNLGLRHSADPLAQTVAALAYISRHYGGTNSTCVAWAYWKKHSSY